MMDECIRKDLDKWRDDANRRKQNLASIKTKIAKQGSRDIDVLEAAGTDTDYLLDLLARISWEDRSKGWKEAMRRRRDKLRSLAARLETLADECEKLELDVRDSGLHLISGNLAIGIRMTGRKPATDDPEQHVGVSIDGIRSLARIFRNDAEDVIIYMREFGQTDYALLMLSFYVFERTGSHHFDKLARLVTDAFEAVGKNDQCSADRLSRNWSRHGKKLKLLHLELQTKLRQMILAYTKPYPD